MYDYDQVYSYEKILQEVKQLIFPTIVEMVNPEDVKNLGLKKEILADVFYSHIMALAYNDGDLSACLEDLMPFRSPAIYMGSDEEDAAVMSLYLSAMGKEFDRQVRAFKVFHNLTQELAPRDEVLMHVQLQLQF